MPLEGSQKSLLKMRLVLISRQWTQNSLAIAYTDDHENMWSQGPVPSGNGVLQIFLFLSFF